MPTTIQEEAIRSILESLEKLNDPQFTQKYLEFLKENKLHFQPFTDLMDKLSILGPTLSDPTQTKTTIHKLKLDTRKFLDISKPLDPTTNAGTRFESNALIIAIKQAFPSSSPQPNIQPTDTRPCQQQGLDTCITS